MYAIRSYYAYTYTVTVTATGSSIMGTATTSGVLGTQTKTWSKDSSTGLNQSLTATTTITVTIPASAAIGSTGNVITSYSIHYTKLYESNSYAQLSGDTGTQSLAVGLNEFSIVCTAQDGITTETYAVNITRVPSSEAALSDLTIDGSTVSGFSGDVYSYDITVDFTTDHIIITSYNFV